MALGPDRVLRSTIPMQAAMGEAGLSSLTARIVLTRSMAPSQMKWRGVGLPLRAAPSFATWALCRKWQSLLVSRPIPTRWPQVLARPGLRLSAIPIPAIAAVVEPRCGRTWQMLSVRPAPPKLQTRQ